MGRRKNQENVIEVPANLPSQSQESPTPATTPTPSEERPPNTASETETPSATETGAESATAATSEPSPKPTESAAPSATLVEASKLAAEHSDPESDARWAFWDCLCDRVLKAFPGERTLNPTMDAWNAVATAVTNAADPSAAINIANLNEIEMWAGILKNMTDEQVKAIIEAKDKLAEKAVR